MPTLDTSRKHVSEVVATVSKTGTEGAINYHYALVDVKGSTTIEPIGTPLVFDDTDAFVVYSAAADITGLTNDSTLPDGSPIAVTVGTYEGVGANFDDVTLTSTATKMWVIYRGEGGVKDAGIVWGSANAASQTAYKLQLEKQRLAVVEAQTQADPSFI